MKLRLFVAATAATAAASFVGQAEASPHHSLPVYHWHGMSLAQTAAAQKNLIRIDWKIITTWRNQRRLAVVRQDLWPSSLATIEQIGWHWKHMKWTQRELRKTLARLAKQHALPWAFWDCVATGRLHGYIVSSGEGGATSYNPAGYYGRYQMNWGFMRHWGADMLRKYGGRDARSWSVADQTVVAERGFHGQGSGAWPHTAPPCLSLRE